MLRSTIAKLFTKNEKTTYLIQDFPPEILITCFSYLDEIQLLIIGTVCKEWKGLGDEIVNKSSDGHHCNLFGKEKTRYNRRINRNLFRRWLGEWICSNRCKFQLQKEKLDQTLILEECDFENIQKRALIFGDVKQDFLEMNTSVKSEEEPKSIVGFFKSLIAYSKHDNVVLEEAEKLENVKFAMFGSELSSLYHYMTTGKKSNRWLAGCDLAIVNYHSQNSNTCYKYMIFANGGSDKYVGVSKSYFKGSHFVVLLFDSEHSLHYLSILEPMMDVHMELIFIQVKHSNSPKVVEKHVVEQFIYSNFGEGVYLEVDEENLQTMDSILMYSTLLSDILMGCNLRKRNGN